MAEAAGARLESLPITAAGPGEEELAIDVAWLGSQRPQKVLLHSSGLHGVEAFAGSAIQLQLLETPPVLDTTTALILVHVLNPYGMAWLRRFNENNVDLNRNFLNTSKGESYRGSPEGYAVLDALLNPSRLPWLDVFALKAGWLILRHGLSTLEQAIVSGQYDYPEGLFFGGSELQEGPRLYKDFLERELAGAERIFAIDVHTGLGPFGEDTVLVAEENFARLRAALGERVEAFSTSDDNVAYEIRGGLHEMLPRLLGAVQVDFVGQEFGTFGQVRVLGALRKENFAHHHRAPSMEDPFKQDLRDAFYPDDEEWREKVLGRGRELFEQGLRLLSDGS